MVRWASALSVPALLSTRTLASMPGRSCHSGCIRETRPENVAGIVFDAEGNLYLCSGNYENGTRIAGVVYRAVPR